jgi:sugar/nucleoside kinase (ribokinase family)
MSYNVYGLGNALVDIQYRVSPDFLSQSSIDKGVMTLVEADRQAELVGLLDQDPVTSASGGSAANTLIGIAQFGGSAYYACQLGRDEWGDFYHRDLEAAGVKSDATNRVDDPTGTCMVFITPDADRTLNTFLGANLSFGPKQITAEPIAKSQYIYIEGYLASGDDSFDACLKAQDLAQKNGTKVSLTLSDPFMVNLFKERFTRLVDNGVDLLFCNEDESLAYTGAADRDTACAALAQKAATVCVTCGPDGILLATQGQTHQVAGVQVEAVDTTGAGDMFAGGYLYGVTNGYTPVQAAQLGSYAAAQVVARFGPRLESDLADIPAILKHFSA